jgi:flagellar hook-basal body complex protein FliE
MIINPISDRGVIGTLKSAVQPEKSNSPFSELIDSGDASQKQSDQFLSKLVSGQDVEAHDVMLSLRKAEINFQLILQLRNKLMDAYQSIMRTEV